MDLKNKKSYYFISKKGFTRFLLMLSFLLFTFNLRQLGGFTVIIAVEFSSVAPTDLGQLGVWLATLGTAVPTEYDVMVALNYMASVEKQRSK